MQTRLIIIHQVNPAPAKFGKLVKPKRRRDAAPTSCDSARLVFVDWLPGRLIRCTGTMLAGALLLVAGVAGRADTSPASFDAANTAFSQGRYVEAARGFESVLAQKGFSAPVLYNLANAQLRDGKLGPAILNYERARALAPNDPDITANLKLARAQAAGPATVTWRDSRLTRLLTLNAWGWLAASALLIVCIAAVLQRLLRRGTMAIRFIGAVQVAVFLAALSVLTLRWRELDRAIVVAGKCPLRISPTSIGEQLFPLHEGETVTLQRTLGEYAFVRTHNGRAGWVKRSDIGRVYATAQN